jgi:hypothetical protein
MIRFSLSAVVSASLGERGRGRDGDLDGQRASRAVTPAGRGPADALISAAAQDGSLVAELLAHLHGMQRDGSIRVWHEGHAAPGCDARARARLAAATADLVLVLLSADFLALCADERDEMRIAVDRHRAGLARLVPIVVRPCDLSGSPFAELESLPRGALPVTRWPDRDEAWVRVVEGIRSAIRGDRGPSSRRDGR